MTNNPDEMAPDAWTEKTIRNGDVEAMRKQAVEDPDYLRSHDYMGDTPLLTAIAYGKLEIVKLLLELGADPNVEVDDGFTCLITACEPEDDFDSKETVAIVKALIAAGADIHKTGDNGGTALHKAAAHGHAALVQALIDAGARVDHGTDADGETPLLVAARFGRAEVVQVLLRYGADPSQKNSILGQSPLDVAQESVAGLSQEGYDILKELFDENEMEDVFDGLGISPEELAIIKQEVGDLNMAEQCLRASNEVIESGDHAEVIRMLTEQQKNQKPKTNWLAAVLSRLWRRP